MTLLGLGDLHPVLRLYALNSLLDWVCAHMIEEMVSTKKSDSMNHLSGSGELISVIPLQLVTRDAKTGNA